MNKEEKIYCYCLRRYCSLKDIQAWNEGESKELKKWFGFGFFNHLFVSQDNIVRLYYNYEEGEKFWEALQKNLTEELFDNLCDSFFQLIEESKTTNLEEELFKITVKCWPILTVFDEISKYPELATEYMLRRLARIRNLTEAFSYELSKRLNHENLPKDYILFKGNLLFKPFTDFIKENNVVIKDE